MLNLFDIKIDYGTVTIRTVGGRVLGWYTEDPGFTFAVRKDDATFRKCSGDDAEYDAWAFITCRRRENGAWMAYDKPRA